MGYNEDIMGYNGIQWESLFIWFISHYIPLVYIMKLIFFEDIFWDTIDILILSRLPPFLHQIHASVSISPYSSQAQSLANGNPNEAGMKLQESLHSNSDFTSKNSGPLLPAMALKPVPQVPRCNDFRQLFRCSAHRCRLETPDGHALSPPMPVHGYVAAGGTAVAAPVATMAAPAAAAVPVMAQAPGETGGSRGKPGPT